MCTFVTVPVAAFIKNSQTVIVLAALGGVVVFISAREKIFGPDSPLIRRLTHSARSAGVEMILPSAMFVDMLSSVASKRTSR